MNFEGLYKVFQLASCAVWGVSNTLAPHQTALVPQEEQSTHEEEWCVLTELASQETEDGFIFLEKDFSEKSLRIVQNKGGKCVFSDEVHQLCSEDIEELSKEKNQNVSEKLMKSYFALKNDHYCLGIEPILDWEKALEVRWGNQSAVQTTPLNLAILMNPSFFQQTGGEDAEQVRKRNLGSILLAAKAILTTQQTDKQEEIPDEQVIAYVTDLAQEVAPDPEASDLQSRLSPETCAAIVKKLWGDLSACNMLEKAPTVRR